MAARFAREISASERNLSGISRHVHLYTVCSLLTGSLSAISVWKPDRTKALASQIASKSYFSGEIAGLRLSRRTGRGLPGELAYCSIRNLGQNELEKPQAHTSPIAELAALRKRVAEALTELRAKQSHLTVRDLKHLLFRCAATLISAPKVSTLSTPRLQRSLIMTFSVIMN